MGTLIEARGLAKSYGATRALDDVSFTVDEGRIVGLIGPNGAGKTTVLKALLGLTPFAGHLRVAGLDPYRQRDALMQEVCFIADVAVLPRWIRVDQVVAFVEGVHPRFRPERCRELLARTSIPPKARVKTLSFSEMLLSGEGLEEWSNFTPENISSQFNLKGVWVWHIPFFWIPHLPEMLITGREREFWEFWIKAETWNPNAITNTVRRWYSPRQSIC